MSSWPWPERQLETKLLFLCRSKSRGLLRKDSGTYVLTIFAGEPGDTIHLHKLTDRFGGRTENAKT